MVEHNHNGAVHYRSDFQAHMWNTNWFKAVTSSLRPGLLSQRLKIFEVLWKMELALILINEISITDFVQLGRNQNNMAHHIMLWVYDIEQPWLRITWCVTLGNQFMFCTKTQGYCNVTRRDRDGTVTSFGHNVPMYSWLCAAVLYWIGTATPKWYCIIHYDIQTRQIFINTPLCFNLWIEAIELGLFHSPK